VESYEALSGGRRYFQKWHTELHAGAQLDVEGSDGARETRAQLVLHLHRLDDHDDAAGLHRITDRHRDLDDGAGDWREHHPAAVPQLVAVLGLLALPPARPQLLDLAANAVIEEEADALLRNRGDELVALAVDRDGVTAGADRLDRRIMPDAFDPGAAFTGRVGDDLDLDLAVVEP
jgi:hypothetical protein